MQAHASCKRTPQMSELLCPVVLLLMTHAATSIHNHTYACDPAQVDLFGRPVWSKDVAFKPKTYSYFWMRDDVACARSSGGTLTLMKRLAA